MLELKMGKKKKKTEEIRASHAEFYSQNKIPTEIHDKPMAFSA